MATKITFCFDKEPGKLYVTFNEAFRTFNGASVPVEVLDPKGISNAVFDLFNRLITAEASGKSKKIYNYSERLHNLSTFSFTLINPYLETRSIKIEAADIPYFHLKKVTEPTARLFISSIAIPQNSETSTSPEEKAQLEAENLRTEILQDDEDEARALEEEQKKQKQPDAALKEKPAEVASVPAAQIAPIVVLAASEEKPAELAPLPAPQIVSTAAPVASEEKSIEVTALPASQIAPTVVLAASEKKSVAPIRVAQDDDIEDDFVSVAQPAAASSKGNTSASSAVDSRVPLPLTQEQIKELFTSQMRAQFSQTKIRRPGQAKPGERELFGLYLMNRILEKTQSYEYDEKTPLDFTLSFATEQNFPLTKLPEGKSEKTLEKLKKLLHATIKLPKKFTISFRPVEGKLAFQSKSFLLQWPWDYAEVLGILEGQGNQIRLQMNYYKSLGFAYAPRIYLDFHVSAQDFVDFVECNLPQKL